MGQRGVRLRSVLSRPTSFRRGTAILAMSLVATVGIMMVILVYAASQVAVFYDPGATSTKTGVTSTGTDATAGTSYVQFGTPGFCASHTFTGTGYNGTRHCVGAAEMATHTCIWPNQAVNDCAATTFICIGYNSAKTSATGVYPIYNLTSFGKGTGGGSNHSGGQNPILNDTICGKDYYSIVTGASADHTGRNAGTGAVTSQNAPQSGNCCHAAAAAGTQATLNSYLTGDEYDPTKP
jgi:hypothetical protein